jgi:hypothetical protein
LEVKGCENTKIVAFDNLSKMGPLMLTGKINHEYEIGSSYTISGQRQRQLYTVLHEEETLALKIGLFEGNRASQNKQLFWTRTHIQ